MHRFYLLGIKGSIINIHIAQIAINAMENQRGKKKKTEET
jgi:hypothetical protein